MQFSPGRAIAHNYMGMFDQFDHCPVAAELDIASWDSYPLGQLQNMKVAAPLDTQTQSDCLRTGDPDFQAFHHDLYRGMGRLRVMEQQPGPVNWPAQMLYLPPVRSAYGALKQRPMGQR